MKMTNQYIGITDNRYDQSNGTLTYGTTIARATAKFLNRLVISEGQYLNTDGQPSGFDILQNENYNNFTYIITLEKEIAKYKEALLNLLHPTGMKVIGRYAMKSNSSMDMSMSEAYNRGNTLQYYTGSAGSTATISVPFNNRTNLVPWSNQFQNSGWVKSLITAVANNTIAPDGANSADFIQSTTTTGEHYLNYDNITANTQLPYTWSVIS